MDSFLLVATTSSGSSAARSRQEPRRHRARRCRCPGAPEGSGQIGLTNLATTLLSNPLTEPLFTPDGRVSRCLRPRRAGDGSRDKLKNYQGGSSGSGPKRYQMTRPHGAPTALRAPHAESQQSGASDLAWGTAPIFDVWPVVADVPGPGAVPARQQAPSGLTTDAHRCPQTASHGFTVLHTPVATSSAWRVSTSAEVPSSNASEARALPPVGRRRPGTYVTREDSVSSMGRGHEESCASSWSSVSDGNATPRRR